MDLTASEGDCQRKSDQLSILLSLQSVFFRNALLYFCNVMPLLNLDQEVGCRRQMGMFFRLSGIVMKAVYYHDAQRRAGRCADFLSACSEAICAVVIDHADGLHESITDGRAHEFEAALLEIRRHRI